MAIITNTFTRYSDVGIREELADVIFNISLGVQYTVSCLFRLALLVYVICTMKTQ